VALSLKIPIFLCVTKVDMCPLQVLQHSLQQLTAILKKPGVKKRPFLVKSPEVHCWLSWAAPALNRANPTSSRRTW